MDGSKAHVDDTPAQSSSGQHAAQKQGTGIGTEHERQRSLSHDVTGEIETVSTQAQSSSGQHKQGAGISIEPEVKTSQPHDVFGETISTTLDVKSTGTRLQTTSSQIQRPTAGAKGNRSASRWRLGKVTAGAAALLAALAFLWWRQMPSIQRLDLATGVSLDQGTGLQVCDTMSIQ